MYELTHELPNNLTIITGKNHPHPIQYKNNHPATPDPSHPPTHTTKPPTTTQQRTQMPETCDPLNRQQK